MAKKLIKETIVLQRAGKRIVPEIGKLFDLTDDEIASIVGVRPQAIADVETPEVDPNSESDAAAKKGGSKKAASEDL